MKLRNAEFFLIKHILSFLPQEKLSQRICPNSKGYERKTIAYNAYHIFRIEDIVCNQLILKQPQVFDAGDYQKKMNSPIRTTGNEIDDVDIESFSIQLNIDELINYGDAVKEKTDQMLKNLKYQDLKIRFNEEDKKNVIASNSVSNNDKAIWLVDYWCKKDIKGLIKMPFSHHWLMHVDGACKIKNAIFHQEFKKNQPIAYCGLVCNACYLKQKCGGCRGDYNICSYATMYQDKICPNVSCCKNHDYEGCWQCEQLETCTKGFFEQASLGGNAAKANCLFINKYGKIALLKTYLNLRSKYDFKKAQEILGVEYKKGFEILEENKG